ncbi:MAG: epoxyqueuosine reductase QueH [Dysosmobacter sp.]
MACGTSAGRCAATSTTGAAAAITSACGRPPATRRSTGTAASPAPCSSAPTRTTSCCGETAEEAAEAYGVAFLYRDFRPGFRAGQQEARERGFYMQKYCGCVFSEEDRYRKQIDRDLKQPEKIIQG